MDATLWEEYTRRGPCIRRTADQRNCEEYEMIEATRYPRVTSRLTLVRERDLTPEDMRRWREAVSPRD